MSSPESYDPQPNDKVNVFIVSRLGRSAVRRVLWQMSREDAQKVCSDDRTGIQYTPNSMLCYTEFSIDDPEVGKFVEDDGRYAGVLEELGATVLDSLAMREAQEGD